MIVNECDDNENESLRILDIQNGGEVVEINPLEELKERLLI